MKTIHIFAFPSHVTKERTGGVDYFRVIQPMKQLDGYELNGYKFKVEIFDPAITGIITKPEKILDYWIDVFKRNEMVFLNYTADPWGFAPMGAMARHFQRTMVLDVDDSLWNIQPDNPAYLPYKKGGQAITDFTAICNEVDYMTTTNTYLKNIIAFNTLKRHEYIKVFPNYVDLDNVYTHRSPFKNTVQIQLLHHGSTTHFIDLADKEFEKGIDKIMWEYPNVVFKTVGAQMPVYKNKWGQRYFNAFGAQDYYDWATHVEPVYMDESDIVVVPLAENIYTRAKSDIKFSESSTFMKPGCYQDIRQYQETVKNGENGFLCNSAEDWYKSIKALIDSPELRQKMAKKAFDTVVKEKQAKNHRQEWAQYLLDILHK